MEHAFVAFAGGAGLIGIDAGDDNDLICYLFLYTGQAVGIIADGIFIIRRAGTDDQEELVAFSGEHFGNFLIPLFLNLRQFQGEGVLFPDLTRRGELGDEFETHGNKPP